MRADIILFGVPIDTIQTGKCRGRQKRKDRKNGSRGLPYKAVNLCRSRGQDALHRLLTPASARLRGAGRPAARNTPAAARPAGGGGGRGHAPPYPPTTPVFRRTLRPRMIQGQQ